MQKCSSDHPFTFIFLGDSYTGKTSLVHRFSDNEFQDNHPTTINIEYKNKTIQLSACSVRIQCCDTAGQERYNAITKSYVRPADVIFITYDICNQNSYVGVKKWLNMARDVTTKAILVLVGNKIDLEHIRCVPSAKARVFADEMKIYFYEVSAKTGEGVLEMFKVVAECMVVQNGITQRKIRMSEDLRSVKPTQNTCAC